MNRIDKPDAFDPESIRRKISEVRTIEPGAPDKEQDGGTTVDLNPLAQQIALQFRAENYSPNMITGLLRLLEFTVLFAIGYGITMFYVIPSMDMVLFYIGVIAAGSALGVLLLHVADTYQIPSLRAAWRMIPRLLGAWAIAFATMALALFFFKVADDTSRVWFMLWFVLGAIYLVAERQLIAYSIRRWARNGTMERRAVIAGGGEPAKELIRALERQPDNDIRICGIFDDRDERRSPSIVAGYPKLGTIAELVEFARLARIDMLIISLPLSAETRILSL
ncbi:MAG TPA: undecaprenyl-phosphate glucose phosphotransferase, partial [Mycoplana sp.]|nr:undecaprenyl-phosphate glucose phosphotransferase [Mycoplana sp.]